MANDDMRQPSETEAGPEINTWLDGFEAALTHRDASSLGALFQADGIWRDVVALSWHLRTTVEAHAIASALLDAAATTRPRDFRIDETRTPPRWVTRAGTHTLEVIIAFETEAGRCSGVLRLVPDGSGGLVAWTLITNLEALKGFEERIGERRPSGENYSRSFGGDNWLDMRERVSGYADRDPTALVVGGGQAGLAIAARLGQLDIDTLIVDRHERIGDNWRKRYHSLTLHNEVYANHLPYMAFPTTWPTYVPKDKIANWFESYADALELNFWTGTELIRGRYDDAARSWTVTLRRSDGSERVMRPRHLIFATGANTRPYIPDLPGLSDFAGEIRHSEATPPGRPGRARRHWYSGPAIAAMTRPMIFMRAAPRFP